MNDSSPPSSSAPEDKTAGDSTPDTTTTTSNDASFAFLVHSQDTLTNNLPPDVDNKSLARQKRRRTSPEDQIILEGEYARNPKPDKAARLKIVKRVALGEKEVQIWFQNRRQSTRRKSRPLSRHEILSSLQSHYRGSGVKDPWSSSAASLDDIMLRSSAHVSNSQENRVQVFDASTPTLQTPASQQDRKGVLSVSSEADIGIDMVTKSTQVSDDPPSSQTSTAPSQVSSSSYGPSFESQPTDLTTSYPGPSSQNSTRSTTGPGYISNRRNAMHSRHKADHPPGSQGSLSEKPPIVEIPALKRTSSQIRLSLSFDGKAQVVTDENSPPMRQPLASNPIIQRAGLQRSQSEIALTSMIKQNQNNNPVPLPRRMPSGRSRDSRAWDFYCDRDARNALSAKAEQEQSGSAVGVIGLLRSRSNGAWSANANKRRLDTSRPGAAKRTKSMVTVVQKPILARVSSSIARLQADEPTVKKQVVKGKSKAAKPGLGRMASPSGDSDKENWAPGTQQTNMRRRRTPQIDVTSRRRILKENPNIPSQSSSLGALMSRDRKQQSGMDEAVSDENKPPEVDSEVADFMARSGEAREEDDLECVENLLSLSQGTWK
ncbi:MAG: hypothetical protein M1835_006720 [Candelina submexicana]|nr:MAG: hypothetical protein M1835_006720 [Candelina submexicana]